MKHPLWILNSAIAVLCIGAFLFMLFSRQKKPYREQIEPELSAERIKQDEVKINLSKIYENDLFDTYQKEFPKPVVQPPQISLPEPPQPEVPHTPEMPKPSFLDPLDITLKGIIVIASDDSKNRAVIQDSQTMREQTYKVGNMIADAQLIRIFNNKVIFLRSNGQQEVLYLREKDAESDPAYTKLNDWDDVVKLVDAYHRTINPHTFVERVGNLAHFIDLLDLTTAFAKGKSIGCRVGKIQAGSLGAALGFMTGDIITKVDDIPATDTPHRFNIYKKIVAKEEKDPITVELIRDNQPLTLQYALDDFSILDKIEESNPAQELAQEEKMKERQLKAMQQKHSFAPSVRDIKKRERQNMLSRGKMPAQYNPKQTAE